MPMHENSSLLRKALIYELPSDIKIETEPIEDSDILYRTMLSTGDRKLRKQMRLMFKAMLDSHLSSVDRNSKEWHNELRLIPSWPSNKRTSSNACDRLLKIAEWAGDEQGIEQSASWMWAARIPGWMMEDYSMWTHNSQSYGEAAGWFFASLRYGGWSDDIFVKLLNDLQATE